MQLKGGTLENMADNRLMNTIMPVAHHVSYKGICKSTA